MAIDEFVDHVQTDVEHGRTGYYGYGKGTCSGNIECCGYGYGSHNRFGLAKGAGCGSGACTSVSTGYGVGFGTGSGTRYGSGGNSCP